MEPGTAAGSGEIVKISTLMNSYERLHNVLENVNRLSEKSRELVRKFDREPLPTTGDGKERAPDPARDIVQLFNVKMNEIEAELDVIRENIDNVSSRTE